MEISECLVISGAAVIAVSFAIILYVCVKRKREVSNTEDLEAVVAHKPESETKPLKGIDVSLPIVEDCKPAEHVSGEKDGEMEEAKIETEDNQEDPKEREIIQLENDKESNQKEETVEGGKKEKGSKKRRSRKFLFNFMKGKKKK